MVEKAFDLISNNFTEGQKALSTLHAKTCKCAHFFDSTSYTEKSYTLSPTSTDYSSNLPKPQTF